MPAAYTYITLLCENSNPTDTPIFRGWNSAYETKERADIRFLPICACVYAAGGCVLCGRFACCTQVKVQITLHTPSALAAVFSPYTAPTSLVVYEKRAVTPYKTSQCRPCARPNALFCLGAACFPPGVTRMKPWLGGNIARSSCKQTHLWALEARSIRQFCTPVPAADRHMSRVCRRVLRVLFALCLPWPAHPSLFLPTIPVRRDGNAPSLRSKQTGMVGFSALPWRSPWPQGGIKSL